MALPGYASGVARIFEPRLSAEVRAIRRWVEECGPIAVGDRTGEVRYLGEIGNTPEATRKLVTKLAAKYGRLHFCCEADPTGLHRQIVTVVFPARWSLIPETAGDPVKTDRPMR